MIFLTNLRLGNFRGKVFLCQLASENSNRNGDNGHP
ncbi:hypothetical protein SAMN05878482_101897 [Peribacillus simplex]|uniref:Uncharacterized protein n=1 Tax=Peribacillus simplex TaxID=1478 RepID=A0A9X8WI50_9BACI|nr:hypothetical protein SAMN05878482_101897 [Peribacillus simplex]